MSKLHMPSSLQPPCLESCQQWRAAVFGLGRHAKTALTEVKTICQAELLLSSSARCAQLEKSGISADKCVRTIQDASRRLHTLVQEMKTQAEVLPESSREYRTLAGELEELLEDGHQASGLWHRVKVALEDIQSRGATDLQHLGDCQRALSKKRFMCGGGKMNAVRTNEILSLHHNQHHPPAAAA